jgi:phospholipase C
MGDGRFDIELITTPADTVTLVISNQGAGLETVEVTDAYSGAVVLLPIGPGKSVHRSVNINNSAHWYDLTIAATGLRHHYRGHVETGRPTMTDPNMGKTEASVS